MSKKIKKVLKKKKGYSYLHHKTGEKVVVGPHKQHYRVRRYKNISRRKAMEAFDKRSNRSKSIDKANRSKHTKEDPDEQWLENQNRIDIEGIDTPENTSKTSTNQEIEKIKKLMKDHPEKREQFEDVLASQIFLKSNSVEDRLQMIELVSRTETLESVILNTYVEQRPELIEKAIERLAELGFDLEKLKQHNLSEKKREFIQDYIDVKGIVTPKQPLKEGKITTLESLGGSHWQKYGKNRVYFNAPDLAVLLGYEWTNYKTGNIKSAKLGDEQISNSQMKRILNDLNCKLYYDLDTNSFHYKSGIGFGKEYTQEAIDLLNKKLK